MPNPKANDGSLAGDGDPPSSGRPRLSVTRSQTNEIRQSDLEDVMSQMATSGKSKSEAEERSSWTAGRTMVHKIIHSHSFDLAIGLAITFNLVILLVEIDQRAGCYPEQCGNASITTMNRCLLGVYTIEAMMRMYVQRSMYPKDHWNILDVSLVLSGYFDEVISSLVDGGGGLDILPVLRILRVARFLRAIRLLRFFPELYVMIRGFLFAMKAMAWGLLLIICLLTLWSALFMELLNPINRTMMADKKAAGEEVNESCEAIFGSLLNSLIFFFQTLVAGDGWGSCSVPLIFYANWTFFLFGMSLMSVSLGMMNLILAIIVDHASAARDSDKEGKLKAKQKEKGEAIEKWKSVIQLFDENQDGHITYKEMMMGYEVKEIREVLEVMGIDKHDLHSMFKLMDEDDSGDLQYDEFISSFLKAQGQEPMVYSMMMKLQIDKIIKMFNRVNEKLEIQELAWNHGDMTPLGPMVGRHGSKQSSNLPAAGAPWEQPSMQSQEKDTTHVPHSLTAQIAEDFKLFSMRVQAQFEALDHRLELNTLTMQECSQVFQAANLSQAWKFDWKNEHSGTTASLRSVQSNGDFLAGVERNALPPAMAASPARSPLGSSVARQGSGSQGSITPLRAPRRPPDPARV